jgi:hypothetical protein
MFYLIWGTCMRGTIITDNGRTLKTRFFHLWYLPIIPIGGAECIGDDDYEAEIDGTSVLLGYLRTYLFLGAALSFFNMSEGGNVVLGMLLGIAWLVSMFAGRNVFQTNAE